MNNSFFNSEFMKSIQRLTESVQKTFAPLQPLQDYFKRFAAINPLGQLNKYFEEHPEIVESLRRFQNWDKIIAQQAERLAKYGWYLCGDLTLIDQHMSELLDRADRGEDSPLNDYMMAALNTAKDTIESKAYDDFPIRRNILECAFNSHWSGNYIASVPLLLIQADGVAYDKLGCLEEKFQLFAMQKGKPRFSKILKQAKDCCAIESYSDVFLSSLGVATMIHGSATDAVNSGNHFNRNAILHGISVSYANELNSYRAYSLFAMLASWLTINLKDDKTSPAAE